MPRLLTRGKTAADIGYRVAGFISESWPTSNRNGGRLRLGMGGRLPSESAPGLGLDGTALFDAYLANQSELADVAFDNSPVAVAVLAMMESVPAGEWVGTATQLLDALCHPDVTTERTRNSFGWPKTPQLLGTQMVRAAPALRKRGIDARQRKSGNIVWEIRKA